MLKKAVILILLFSLLAVGCSKAPQTAPVGSDEAGSVSDVGSGISGIDQEEKELDSSDLEGMDSALSDIENS